MLIHSVTVRNYRCIKDATLGCEGFTSMVGPNGVGKSTFLRALELFYDPSPRISTDDFFAADISSELSIAITYRDLTPGAQSLFGKYVRDDELTVERVFSLVSGKATSRYHGAILRNSAFQAVRAGLEVKDRGKTARAAYDDLRSRAEYQGLPAWTLLGDVPGALAVWEDANANSCARERDVGNSLVSPRRRRAFSVDSRDCSSYRR